MNYVLMKYVDKHFISSIKETNEIEGGIMNLNIEKREPPPFKMQSRFLR